MHETMIAKNIIKEAQKQGQVEEIFLEIGQLAHVPLHDLVPCLESLVNWTVYAKEKKAQVQCACGYAGRPKILERKHDSFVIACPKCKDKPTLTDGTDIKILKVRVK